MGVFAELGNPVASNLGAIPKSSDAYQILQEPKYNNMGDINWKTGETWGILFSGAIVGCAVLWLFNRYVN
tara:strand:+ start:538 stop:747 length:210 start_codon:yes stop_codon:yes gene_type:complete